MRSEEDIRRFLQYAVGNAPPAPSGEKVIRTAGRRVVRNGVALALSVAVLVSGSLAVSARLTTRKTGVIAPSGGVNRGRQLWVIDLKDGRETRITGGEDVKTDPAWSPDGKRIAFVRGGTGAGIWVLNVETGKLKRLTTSSTVDRSPRWSSDGRVIAFLRDVEGRSVIYYMNSDGTGATRGSIITTAFGLLGDDAIFTCTTASTPASYKHLCRGRLILARSGNRPIVVPRSAIPFFDAEGNITGLSVSRDGGRVAFSFSSMSGLRGDLAVVGLDGRGYRRLENDAPFDNHPTWLRDGRIVFERGGNLWVTDPQNQPGEARITFDPTAHEESPATDPSGRRIVFSRAYDPPTQIYSMKSDGSDLRRLTNVPAVNGVPVSSPDGSKIAFVSARDGFAAVYVMNADGSNVTRLTNDREGAFRPLWSPDGKEIAFFDSDHVMWLMNADGSNQRRIPPGSGVSGSWSLVGSVIALEKEDGLYLMDPHRANLQSYSLRKVSSAGTSPAFGRDDELSFVLLGRIEILGGPGSSKIRILPATQGLDPSQLWWGRGSEILFRSRSRIAAVDASTGKVRFVTHGPANDYNPSWTPDGRILFNSDR